jgi:hypothetical protein
MKSFIFLTVIGITGSLTAQKHWNTTAKFDGKSYLAVAEPAVTEKRPKLTVEFWIKPDKDSSSTTILGNKQFWVLTEYGRIRLVANGGYSTYSKSLLKGNQWTHVAAVYDGDIPTGTVKIYFNGVFDTSEAFTEPLYAQPDSFVVGKKYFNTFSGEIDEIRVWRVARTADQILKNFRTHISSYWLSDIFHYGELAYVQSYESDISDSLFYLPNGKINGTVTPVASGMMSSPTVRHNNSVYFEGGTFSWLESTTANDTDVCFTGDLTVEAWINPSSFDTRMVIVDLNNGGGGFQLSTVANAKLNWYLPPQATTTAMALLPNTWYHVAVVVDSASPTTDNARIYVNGKLINTSTHNKMTLNTGKLRIGASHFQLCQN